MKAVVFRLHFNRFNAKRQSREIWTVRFNNRNHYVRRVLCHVPIVTVYRGDTAPQPRAYLRGVGRIRIKNSEAVIF